MNGLDRVRPFLGQIRDEHRELHKFVENLTSMLQSKEGCRDLAESGERFCQRLSELRDYLSKHFTEEESGGFLEEAVSYAPHLAPQVGEVEHQHPELLRELDEILRRLSSGKLTEAAWQQCCADFVHFKELIFAHEALENSILERGFNVPLDLNDRT